MKAAPPTLGALIAAWLAWWRHTVSPRLVPRRTDPNRFRNWNHPDLCRRVHR